MIIEKRNICLLQSPDIIAYIGPQDGNGNRIMFVNVAAAPDAKVIRVLQNCDFTYHPT